LKLQFAKSITLGCAIANVLEPPVDDYVVPLFEASLPADYKKWAKPLLDYTVRSTAISIAWFIQKIISGNY
jgi:hypothetical protein